MKKVGIIYDNIYAQHYTHQHPECDRRVEHTIELFKENEIYGNNRTSQFIEINPYNATIEQLKWVHNENVITTAKKKSQSVKGTRMVTHIDMDTIVSEKSYEAALKAVGGNFAGIDAIMKKEINTAFVLCRPPGHHADRYKSTGFCIFNNVALDVEYLIRKKGIKKVAIIDFDVHAGNGTEHIFRTGIEGGEVFITSLHQHPYTQYPGECFIEDIGQEKQEGKICNVTFLPKTAEESVHLAFKELIIPMLNEFKPEFILISAGYDAHYSDPIGGLQYHYDLYHWMTKKIQDVADKFSEGRVLCTLEGGYNIDAIAKSMVNTVAALAEQKPLYMEDPKTHKKSQKHMEEKLLPQITDIFKDYWDFIK